jgi:hypothetical protein
MGQLFLSWIDGRALSMGYSKNWFQLETSLQGWENGGKRMILCIFNEEGI